MGGDAGRERGAVRAVQGEDVPVAAGKRRGIHVQHHCVPRESGDTSQTPLMVQKDALTSYARLFTLMVAAIARRRMCEGSRSVRGVDDTELGFGAHAKGTFKSLYEAKDMESRT